MLRVASSCLVLATVLHSTLAHTIVSTVWVNGVDNYNNASTYLRMPGTNSPVKDLNSTDMACNVKGTTAVSSFLTVPAGATIEPEWYHSGARGADPIDPSHLGPIDAYISNYDSNGSGAVWVKIAEEGWSNTTQNWATTRMIANAGRNTVVIPSDLAAGKYLVRFSIEALHQAESAGGAEFYPNCAQIEVTGSGSSELPTGISFPGTFTSATPGIIWNIYYSSTYNIHTDYIIPGPGTWDPAETYSTAQCETPLDGVV